MDELKMIFQLINDVWKFLKRYQGILLSDKTCEEIRREQEAIVEKYKASEDVCKLVQRLAAYENTGLEPGEVCKLLGSRKWIPVEEKLPENGHSVLICGIHGWIDVGWYIRETWMTGFSAAEIVKEVVAWMPLPEPYRKG